ncbi:MAG: hypothetical protein IJZ02_09220, partial [Clostridia bacterium]|nr:hypothetical protein [Clostridia bacterium]
MKKYLALALCLVMLASMFVVFATTASAAGPMKVYNFDVPNAAKDVIKDADLFTPGYISGFIVGNGGGTIVTYDEKEKAICMAPDYTHPGVDTMYVQRFTLNFNSDEAGFVGADYPYVKIKFKLVTENDLTTVLLRDFDWGRFNIISIPEVNTWVEYTADFSGTAWEDEVYNATKGLYLQLQAMDSGYNAYDDTDFKLYVQYIAFFQNEDDAEAYQYTPTDPATLPTAGGSENPNVGGNVYVMPFNDPKSALPLLGEGEKSPYDFVL